MEHDLKRGAQIYREIIIIPKECPISEIYTLGPLTEGGGDGGGGVRLLKILTASFEKM